MGGMLRMSVVLDDGENTLKTLAVFTNEHIHDEVSFRRTAMHTVSALRSEWLTENPTQE